MAMKASCNGKAALLAFVLAASVLTYAQQLWEKKPYSQWTEGDCKKILQDSPWATRLDMAIPVFNVVAALSDDPGARESAPVISYTVQLASAYPIRLALVRQSELHTKMDELNEEQKQAFQQYKESMTAAEFPDRILVRVVYRASVAGEDRELARYWQQQTVEKLKTTVNLINGRGQKIPPMGFSVSRGAGREFQFVFPRLLANGEPMVSPDDRTVSIEFQHPPVGNRKEERIFLQFQTKKLMVNGKLTY